MRVAKPIAIVALLLAVVRLVGCAWIVTAPDRPCTVKSLLIDASPYPVGAAASEGMSPMPDGGWQSALRTVYLANGGVSTMSIMRFTRADIATDEYREWQGAEFAVAPNSGPWSVPEDLDYKSPVADQFCAQCGTLVRMPICIMVARYEEYVVILTAHMYESGLTIEEFEHVMEAVDQKMGDCLK